MKLKKSSERKSLTCFARHAGFPLSSKKSSNSITKQILLFFLTDTIFDTQWFLVKLDIQDINFS